MNLPIILFDEPRLKQQLLPFTFLRPISHIRLGIVTLQEKWERRGFRIGGNLCDKYLHPKFSAGINHEVIYLNGATIFHHLLSENIQDIAPETALYSPEGILIAFRSIKAFATPDQLLEVASSALKEITSDSNSMLSHPWQIFQWNRKEIMADFELITQNTPSQPLSDPYTAVYGKDNLFISEGASIRASVINAEDGPVFIGKNAVIHEGCLIHGAFALGESAHLNMGAKIKGDTTIGPYCKVGGEVSNSVLFAYSNKGHDGFLGNSVIAEWCNLGADTNTSNLKNNYSEVKVWSYASEKLEATGLQFCGLLMGDHSKAGINTMFNTGTVTGIAANVFDAGFPPKFIPSFSWGGAHGFEEFRLEKMYEAAEKMMERRKIPFTQADKNIVKAVFEETRKYRSESN